MEFVKSKERVADHGEVFTPPWMVEAMLDLVKAESERIDSRFLEPACGSGNFLVPVLKRKLTTVHARYGKSDFRGVIKPSWPSCPSTALNCSKTMLRSAARDLAWGDSSVPKCDPVDDFYQAAVTVLGANVVHGIRYR